MRALLKVAKIAITHLSVGLSPQNPPKKFQRYENSLGQLIYKKSVGVVVLEKSAWHTNTCMHALTQTQEAFYNLPLGLKPGGR